MKEKNKKKKPIKKLSYILTLQFAKMCNVHKAMANQRKQYYNVAPKNIQSSWSSRSVRTRNLFFGPAQGGGDRAHGEER